MSNARAKKQDGRPNQDGALPATLSQESEIWLAVLAEMPVAVILAEVPSGRFLWYNKRAVDLLGHEAIPVSGTGDYALYAGVHEDGRPYEAHEYPLARAVLDGEVVERELLHYRRGDGRRIILQLNASRVRGPQGQLVAVCTFQDVTAEHQAQSALSEAAVRVELALEAGAIVGTWVWNLKDNLLTADERFAQSFGLDPERCRAGLVLADMTLAIHPDDQTGLWAAIQGAIANGGDYRHEYRLRQIDGVYRWVEGTGRVELDASGKPVRFPGVLLDITARKQAEETRNLLMREVDHRARNALATVQSVVRLTDASDPVRYREEVIGRVDAMARAQGALSRSNWKGGVLEDLIAEELASCVSHDKFMLAGPKVTLPAEQVQPFSMIVHEMTTNAMKYGALSAHGGTVDVVWKATGRHDFVLTWRERGGPAIQPPTRLGFGSRLITRLANQLDGAIQMDWQAEGLVATLSWRS
jgi:PAS domain S-box-containing protein